MAYYIKNLGKLEKGKRVFVEINKKESSLLLINKCSSFIFSFHEKKQCDSKYLIKNHIETIVIPYTGFWQLAIKSKDVI
jgi:hypothetical protein